MMWLIITEIYSLTGMEARPEVQNKCADRAMLLLKAIRKAPSLPPLASSGPWQHYSNLCFCRHMTVFPMPVSMSNPPLAIRTSCMDYSSSQWPYFNNQIYNDLICK